MMKDSTQAQDNKNGEEIEKKEQKKEDKHFEELEKKVEECEFKYKRALADYQNLEKRIFEERRGLIVSANKELLLRLLPVLDTLMLAQKHSEDQSLKVSAQQFQDVLKSEGVEKIKTEGEEFDPHLMEVVSTEKGGENKVLQEVRAGYRMGDIILRVAQVIVGKGS